MNALDPPHWTLNSCLVAFRTIWVHLGPLSCLTKLGAKRAELVQKFVPRSRVGIFWCISYYLCAFGTVWFPYKTRCQTGRTSAKVRATKSRRNFSQRTHPMHPIGPLTDVLVRFVLFRCFRDHLVALRNSVQNGPN